MDTLPNAKTLDYSKLKQFTECQIKSYPSKEIFLWNIENIVEKGENVDHQQFAHNIFKNIIFQGHWNLGSTVRTIRFSFPSTHVRSQKIFCWLVTDLLGKHFDQPL